MADIILRTWWQKGIYFTGVILGIIFLLGLITGIM